MGDKRSTYLLTLPSYMKPERQSISVDLIAKRNVPNKDSLSSEELVEEIMQLNHVRLDRENICEIDNLDCLGTVTHLYLQHNLIQKIENLELLTHLRFLTLSTNKIKKLENIKHLLNIKFLDLSDNQIAKIDEDELPKSLIILSLSGNPCANQSEYRLRAIKAVPDLEQLDGVMVTREEKIQAGCQVDSESESEEEEEEEDVADAGTTENGEEKGESDSRSLKKHTDDIILRAKVRALKADAAHMKRIDQLEELRSKVKAENNKPLPQ